MGALRSLITFPAGRRRAWIVAALWVIIVAGAAQFGGKLFSAADNRMQAFLPASAESTKVLQRQENFGQSQSAPLAVVYVRDSGITPADRAKAEADLVELHRRHPDMVGPPPQVIPSTDGKALLYSLALPLPPNVDSGVAISNYVKEFHEVTDDRGSGLTVKITGPAAATADIADAFSGFNTKLLLLPLVVVAILLLLIYRSPWLWLVPLIVVGLADQLANAVVYLLAKHAGLTLSSFSAGLLGILVYGAGTDYALLLIARYREELRRHEDRHDAMRFAIRRATPPILASAATVCIGLLCLLSADQNSTRGLGPVGAIGVACALVAMVTLLPALLVILGRWIFWPQVPRVGDSHLPSTGLWRRVGTVVAARPRLTWILTALVLAVMAAGLGSLKLGLSTKDTLRHKPDSVIGQELVAAHYPAGSGAPLDVMARANHVGEVTDIVRTTSGVAGVYEVAHSEGLVWLQAVLYAPPDSTQEHDTIDSLRRRVHGVPGAEALVGGGGAVTLDLNRTNLRDAEVVIPIVLAVVLVILGLLLRAIIAPTVLTLTVILSYLAAWGVSALAFRHLFRFPGVDASMPLVSFVFLVALGIDYNIFLMSRVREEAAHHGTRQGTLVGLAVTGGVITSAGLVLAATFSVITVLPLVAWVELGSVVAFGILLDTIVVRSVLTPALTFDLDQRMWWPSRLSRRDTTRSNERGLARSRGHVAFEIR
jgi:putative drug exporter of the RND superfamily